MRAGYKVFFLIAAFLNIISQESHAQKVLFLKDPDVNYSVDSNYFERIRWANESKFDSAIVLPNKRLFIHNPNVKQDNWYRMKITNNNDELSEWILVSYFYSVDEIDVLVVDSLGRMEKQIFRDTMSVYSREIQHKQPSFPITIRPHETKTIYIRIKNESTYEYSFGIFSHFHFFTRYFREYLLVGLFYGLMLFVLIYTFINYLFFRDNVILIYIFFILSQTVHMLFRDGNGLFIFPNFWEYADLIKNLSRASISVFILLYALSFLKIKRSSPTFRLVAFFIAARIVYAAIIRENTTVITFHFELFAILISTGLSIKAFINKDKDSKYMMVGLSLMSVSYFIFYLSVVWFSTLGNLGFFIMYFGIAGESIFTTLALTERYKRIQMENFKKDEISQELERTVAERTELITMQNKLLEEQSIELNSFLYSASHDLTGPIKSIEGLINLAIIDPKADMKELYGMMREKLTTLENNVIDLNSISIIKDKGKNLREIIFSVIHGEVTKYYSKLIDANNVSVHLNSNIEKPFKDDYFTIKIIYHHLLGNAVKFSDANKESFVKISIMEKNKHIHMVFEDNGIGIDEAILPKIFNMFFRGNDTLKNDTGLGLYIVQLAVKKLNGEIKVKSVLGKGTTFTVIFPL
jgi:signal transduction histidine kinase